MDLAAVVSGHNSLTPQSAGSDLFAAFSLSFINPNQELGMILNKGGKEMGLSDSRAFAGRGRWKHSTINTTAS